MFEVSCSLLGKRLGKLLGGIHGIYLQKFGPLAWPEEGFA